MARPALFALIPVVALAACAPTTPSDRPERLSDTARRCSFADQISGYTSDKDTVYVRSGRQVYKLEAAGACHDLDTGISLGFQTLPGSSQLCVGDWINVITPNTGMSPGLCRARVAQALSPDEIAALPRKLQP